MLKSLFKKHKLVCIKYLFTSSTTLRESMKTFKPTTLDQSLAVLDHLYKYRQFLQPKCNIKQGLADQIQRVVHKSQLDLKTLRIYESMEQLKLINSSSQRIFVDKIVEGLSSAKIKAATLLEIAYFLVCTLPFHNIKQHIQNHSLKLHQLQLKLAQYQTQDQFVYYSKVLKVLRFVGFDKRCQMPAFFNIQKVNYRNCLLLLFNLDLSEKWQQQLLDKYLEADQVLYDKMLHKIEFSDSVQVDKETSRDSFDVISWTELSMLCQSCWHIELDADSLDRVIEIINRKMESQDIPFYNSIQILNFLLNCNYSLRHNSIQRILQSISATTSDEFLDTPISAIIGLLGLVELHKLNPGYFQKFDQIICSSKAQIDHNHIESLRTLYSNKPQSAQLAKLLHN